MKKIECEVQESQTLLQALQAFYPDKSNKSLRDLLKHGSVLVNQEVEMKASLLVEKGQILSILPQEKLLGHGIKILYEDRYFVVIDKPISLLSVPLDVDLVPSAHSILNNHYCGGHIYAVHRLDKEVSGVMVFARGKRSAVLLSALFRKHALNRVYCAIVEGNVKEQKGTWESLLVESDHYKVYATEDEEEGERAMTHFEVVRRSKNFTFLYLTLETGKKHQIRVQCKEAGHPIAGDKLYGNALCNPISRICLHSTKLEFIHPFTGKAMSFLSPLPKAFSKLVNFSF